MQKMVMMMKIKMMMIARSWHTAQFGRCELVGGGEAWHSSPHDDHDEDDHGEDEDGFKEGEDDDDDDFDNYDNYVS